MDVFADPRSVIFGGRYFFFIDLPFSIGSDITYDIKGIFHIESKLSPNRRFRLLILSKFSAFLFHFPFCIYSNSVDFKVTHQTLLGPSHLLENLIFGF